MIIFTKVRWKNFLGTGNNFIELDLDKYHKTILTGPSGSGKSTLLDAICFALFNKPFRQINKPMLVNAVNESECIVEVEFRIGKNDYRVVRGIKPTIFEIFRNDEMIDQNANFSDYQKYLETTILKLNYKSFVQIVVLGASNFTPFMLLRPSDRREIIEEILDIKIFSHMNTLLKRKLLDTSYEVTEIENKRDSLSSNLKIIERHLQETKDKNAKGLREKENKRDEYIEKRRIVESDKKKLQNEIEFLSFDPSIKNDLKSKLKLVRDIQSKIKYSIDSSLKKKKFFSDNDTCPTCTQNIESHFKDCELNNLEDKLSELDRAKKEAESKIDILENKISEHDSLQKKVDELQSGIREYDSNISLMSSWIKSIEEEISTFQNQSLEDKEKEIEMIESEIGRLNNKRRDLLKEKSVLDSCSTILKDTGVKAAIIREYLPLINRYVNSFLDKMNFPVSFSLNENFEESVRARGRGFFTYENFSNGEQQRIDLSLLFAWRFIAKAKNSISTNLLIMDEVVDSYLDVEATENVLSIFDIDEFQKANIIMISHKSEIVEKFDRNISFTKEKGFTRIKNE